MQCGNSEKQPSYVPGLGARARGAAPAAGRGSDARRGCAGPREGPGGVLQGALSIRPPKPGRPKPIWFYIFNWLAQLGVASKVIRAHLVRSYQLRAGASRAFSRGFQLTQGRALGLDWGWCSRARHRIILAIGPRDCGHQRGLTCALTPRRPRPGVSHERISYPLTYRAPARVRMSRVMVFVSHGAVHGECAG